MRVHSIQSVTWCTRAGVHMLCSVVVRTCILPSKILICACVMVFAGSLQTPDKRGPVREVPTARNVHYNPQAHKSRPWAAVVSVQFAFVSQPFQIYKMSTRTHFATDRAAASYVDACHLQLSGGMLPVCLRNMPVCDGLWQGEVLPAALCVFQSNIVRYDGINNIYVVNDGYVHDGRAVTSVKQVTRRCGQHACRSCGSDGKGVLRARFVCA